MSTIVSPLARAAAAALCLHALALSALWPMPPVARVQAPAPLLTRPWPAAPPSRATPAATPPPSARAWAQPRQAKPRPTLAPTPVAATALRPLIQAGSGQLTYQLWQDGRQGLAVLDWAVDAQRFELRMQRHLDGRPLASWVSQGEVTAQGLQPLQYQLQGPRGATQALTPEPGSQDRLSWWLQLPALVRGRQWQVGQQVALPVSLLNGGTHDWVFTLQDQEAGLLHFSRAISAPLQWRIDVWFDPRLDLLPRRVTHALEGQTRWEMSLRPPVTGEGL